MDAAAKELILGSCQRGGLRAHCAHTRGALRLGSAVRQMVRRPTDALCSPEAHPLSRGLALLGPFLFRARLPRVRRVWCAVPIHTRSKFEVPVRRSTQTRPHDSAHALFALNHRARPHSQSHTLARSCLAPSPATSHSHDSGGGCCGGGCCPGGGCCCCCCCCAAIACRCRSAIDACDCCSSARCCMRR